MPVGLGKPCPTGRERIERRREQIGRAVTPRVERALVVGLDEDHVRWSHNSRSSAIRALSASTAANHRRAPRSSGGPARGASAARSFCSNGSAARSKSSGRVAHRVELGQRRVVDLRDRVLAAVVERLVDQAVLVGHLHQRVDRRPHELPVRRHAPPSLPRPEARTGCSARTAARRRHCSPPHHGTDVSPVERRPRGKRDAGGGRERRQPVGEVHHRALQAPRRNVPRPADDRRHADAALEDVVLRTAPPVVEAVDADAEPPRRGTGRCRS